MKLPSAELRQAHDRLLFGAVQIGSEDVAFYSRVPKKQALHYVKYVDIIVTPATGRTCRGRTTTSCLVILDAVTRFDGKSGGGDVADDIANQITEIAIQDNTPINAYMTNFVARNPVLAQSRAIEEISKEYAYFKRIVMIRYDVEEI